MDLTHEQRQAIRQWIADGASLSDVQKRLKSDFGIGMTYMDVRCLVLDIGAQVKDKPAPRPVPPPAPADDEMGAEDAELPVDEDEHHAIPFAKPDAPAAGSVNVTVDRIVRPGAVVSGDVTFSDGTTAKWVLDQMGRLGLEGANPGYRPPAQDIHEFQNQLRSLLQSRGF